MEITQCDICKKVIKSYNDKISVSAPDLRFGIRVSFHVKCAKPVLDFLKKNGFLTKENGQS